uniref:Putative pogo transposable element n=1 Tax=Alternaria alternata TaxID=5599 RepID=A0A3G9HRV6_ALTAL|nr:putative pogo transposable element [Alternaria alternata]
MWARYNTPRATPVATIPAAAHRPYEIDDASQLGQHGDDNSWRELRRDFDTAVADKSKVEARRLEASSHSLQVQNQLLHHENDRLNRSLSTGPKHKKYNNNLDLQKCKKHYGGAVFWSPRKLREARHRESVRRDEARQPKLQKARDKDLKAAVKIYKRRVQQAAKVARQKGKTERDREQKQRAEEQAAQRVLKKEQREAATTEKACDRANKRSRWSACGVLPSPRFRPTISSL